MPWFLPSSMIQTVVVAVYDRHTFWQEILPQSQTTVKKQNGHRRGSVPLASRQKQFSRRGANLPLPPRQKQFSRRAKRLSYNWDCESRREDPRRGRRRDQNCLGFGRAN